jgi:hypothetical protein
MNDSDLLSEYQRMISCVHLPWNAMVAYGEHHCSWIRYVGLMETWEIIYNTEIKHVQS